MSWQRRSLQTHDSARPYSKTDGLMVVLGPGACDHDALSDNQRWPGRAEKGAAAQQVALGARLPASCSPGSCAVPLHRQRPAATMSGAYVQTQAIEELILAIMTDLLMSKIYRQFVLQSCTT